MSRLIIQQRGATLTTRQGALVVLYEDQVVRRLTPEQVEEVQLYGAVELSASARQLLLKRCCDVLCFDGRGDYLGRLLPRESATGARRVAQYQALLSAPTRMQLAREVVSAKLHNQRALLQRARRHGPETTALDEAVVGIRALIRRAASAPDEATLMGLEGRAAALYYPGLSQAITADGFRFTRRTRRPPRDPFNACLSFGYTLLQARVTGALWSAGLDPSLGALHAPGRGKPSLSLDLMEPWRPLVDRLMLTLVNRRQLSVDDFAAPASQRDQLDLSAPEGGELDPAPALDDAPDDASLGPAVHLSASGRAIVIPAFHELMRQRVQDTQRGHRVSLEQLIAHQATRLALGLERGEVCFEAPQWR